MAGPLDIQRVPFSLVGILGMKSTGDTPHTLGQEVRGTIDLSQMYLVDRTLDVGFVNGVAPTVGGFLPVTATAALPQTPTQGTIWLIEYAHLRMATIAAASSIEINLVCQRVNGVQEYLTESLVLPASTAGVKARYFDRPFIVNNGDLLGSFVQNITGAPAVNPSMVIRAAVVSI